MTTQRRYDLPWTDSQNQRTDRQTKQKRDNEAHRKEKDQRKLTASNHHKFYEREAVRGGRHGGITLTKPKPKP
ncbi:hypothetical protein Bca4012_002818 [Brassica carinata]